MATKNTNTKNDTKVESIFHSLVDDTKYLVINRTKDELDNGVDLEARIHEWILGDEIDILERCRSKLNRLDNLVKDDEE